MKLNAKHYFTTEGEICTKANQLLNLDRFITPNASTLAKATGLEGVLPSVGNTAVINQISMLFDANTFIETSAFVTRSSCEATDGSNVDNLEGVICGYGAIDGKLVFIFAEDSQRMSGAVDDRHAKKVCDLYDMALNNGAPIIGIFDSSGADIFGGASSLAAYGRIMKSVAKASGVIPQIALIANRCLGSSAAIASMFDVVVKEKNADFYVSSPVLTGAECAQDGVIAFSGDLSQCAGYIRNIVSFLPPNSSVGIQSSDICADNLNRKLGDLDFGGNAVSAISVICDNGLYYELGHDFAPVVTTVFTTIGGVKCGIVSTSFSVDEGRITADAARKIAKFVNFCDSFSIPLVTLVDSYGFSINSENERNFAPDIGKLAFAYASSTNAKITVILGHAIGSAFILLGSKALGADIVYSLTNSEIGALNADSGVAFAWDKYITSDTSREDLIEKWKKSVSSPFEAASCGEVDYIINTNELRARICSALLMLSYKGQHSMSAYRKVLPL